MSVYRVRFWSGEPAFVSGYDIPASPSGDPLALFAAAGRQALALRRAAWLDEIDADAAPSRLVELMWIACTAGPLWLFVAIDYLLG